jgi:hypothetical protein
VIFLSYAWRERVEALELDAALRDAGFEVWMDHRYLRAEEDILFQLDKAIHDCTLFVMMPPRQRSQTRWMRTELEMARAYAKPILRCAIPPRGFATRLRAMIRPAIWIENSHTNVIREHIR